jgi:hypothetical protein
MKIKSKLRTLPHLGLLNFEGDAVRAYKLPDGDNYIIVDDHMEVIAEWDSLEIFEFTRGDFTVTTSYGKEYRYTDWNDDAKPRKSVLDVFIGIVDLPVVVKKITDLVSAITEDDLKRKSITDIQMMSERNMPPNIGVKYVDGTKRTYSDVSDIIQFLESLKDE